MMAIPASQVSQAPSAPSRQARVLQERLKDKLPEMIRRALEYRAAHGDPVQNLANLLASVTGDLQRWQEIVDEPYG